MSTSVKSLIIVVVIVLIGAGVFFFTSSDSDTEKQTNIETSQSSTNISDNAPDLEQPDTVATFSVAEVAERNTQENCWTIINGSVYDITEYIPRHPGGDEILRACGADGTSLFNERETEDGESVGSGTSHSSRAQSQLATYKIGELAD